MALVYKVHSQGGSDNTKPFPCSHPYISSCKLQPAEISTAATYVRIVMWEGCCTATLYVYFVDQCNPYYSFILLLSCVIVTDRQAYYLQDCWLLTAGSRNRNTNKLRILVRIRFFLFPFILLRICVCHVDAKLLR